MQTQRLFCDVVSCHSFSQAALKHGITQSAVSQRVSQLEKQLGVKLIDRSVRPLELTPSGELYYRGCVELIERYDQLEEEVVKLAGGQQNPDLHGEVVVDAIYSAGIDLLNDAKHGFERQYPHAKVVIEYKHPEAVHEAVRDRQCELGIVSYPDQWRDVKWLSLRLERMAVICSPRHPLARRQSVHATELKDVSMSSFESDLPVGRHIRQFLREHGLSPSFEALFDNLDTIKTAVAMTEQVAILPERTVLPECNAGTLVAIPLEPALMRPMGIIYRRPKHGKSVRGGEVEASEMGLSQVAHAFIDTLRSIASDPIRPEPRVGLGPEKNANKTHASSPSR